MGKVVFIAEKPSVAQDFAKALNLKFTSRDGYQEAENTIVTWCFGHLVTMCYPDAYDPKMKKWSLDTIPFIPDEYRYQVIDSASTKKQFNTVRKLLTDKEVDTIYICTDSGREGEYIYRLVAAQAGVKDKKQLRVWIDSFTKEEILRGIREAKDDSAYDNMGAAAYLRAKEDYLMGINFSRAMSLRYGPGIRNFLSMDHCVIAVGRVMTCVLGIIVRREREIREFVETPFYRVIGSLLKDEHAADDAFFEAEWNVSEASRYQNSPLLYKENGFRKRETAEELIRYLQEAPDEGAEAPVVRAVSRKKETKNPPLLYNLAELQNDCSRFFKISPDQTLDAAQTLYEKKLTTYPRTDARVLSSAVAKEIQNNLKGLSTVPMYRPLIQGIIDLGSWKTIGKTRYTNDKAITDHYAIIPTGQGFQALSSLSQTCQKVYELIVRRFLAIFYPGAVFDKMSLQVSVRSELFQASTRVLRERGYLDVLQYSFQKPSSEKENSRSQEASDKEQQENNPALEQILLSLKKGDRLRALRYSIKEGKTSPPKRYNSGSMILTMENAGQFIEDDELREQIKGSGIGTSATRAGILTKLVDNQYINLNSKTQIYTPTQLGEMIYDAAFLALRPMLDPRLTASWEMGLTRVCEGTTSEEEYRDKLNSYVTRRTNYIKQSDFRDTLQQMYQRDAQFYPKPMHFKAKYSYSGTRSGKSGTAGKNGTSGRKKGDKNGSQ